MRRQLPIGIHHEERAVSSHQHFSAGRPPQIIPVNTWMSGNHAGPMPVPVKPQNGTEPRQYSMTERKLRATAFAERVHGLRYYIGLIGTNAIT